MPNRLLKYLALVLMLGPYAPILATHIVGGEIYYEDLGGNDYLITLKVYRDCGPANTNGTGFDELASVGIYNNGFMEMELLMSLADAEVTMVPLVLENPCFVLPPSLCVQEAVYQELVYLPPTADGYDIVYQRCCRNPSIVNIFMPQDAGATFYTQIPGTNLTTAPNSCPVFNTFPPVALCANADFWFDHSATDIDGDELVYSFCTPMLGGTPDAPAPTPLPPPYNEVTWLSGFSQDNPITANPQFEIDSITGWLTGTPTQAGQYVIGVCVSEYRDGILLSTTNRDFQFNVTICDPNIVAAVPEQTQFCDGLTFNFTNESVNATEFFWDFGDPNNDNDWSTDPEPTYTYSDTGTFMITLIANPSWPCADTSSAWYSVSPLVNPIISEPEFECVEGMQVFDFYSVGDYSETAAFIWDLGTDNPPPLTTVWNPNPIALQGPGSYDISLTVINDGCDSTVVVTIDVPPPPNAVIAPQETFCDGFEFEFGNMSQNADSYQWNFGDPWIGGDSSTEFEPTWTYSDTGLMTVQLMAFADWTCPDVATSTIDIYTLLAPWYEALNPQCFDGNAFTFQALGSEDANAVYSWDFGSNASPPTSSSSLTGVTFNEPGTYGVTLTISENGCVRNYTDSLWVVPDPEFGFFLDNESGCPPLYAQFTDSSFAVTPLYYFWDFGDGSTSNMEHPTHVYHFTGQYDVSVTIQTTNGCVASETFVIPNAITVHAVPSAGIDVAPNTVNILDPTVWIYDLSEGSVGCEYFISDGGYVDLCESSYTFSDGGYFDITQIVTNSFGCRDTARAEVAVEGYMFYAPNAFTPDGDGVNDVWLPVALGVKEYHASVYNRWGQKIWETFDSSTPWMGEVRQGDHYAQNGVYTYRVILMDQLLLPHEFQGHIVLIR